MKQQESSLKSAKSLEVRQAEKNRELRRNIIVGAVLRKIHQEQGTMPYLLQVLEPYLKKTDRQLFGLPF